MQKFFNTNRIVSFFVFICLLLVIYIATLYDLQLYENDSNTALAAATQTYETIYASRGSILDRNGKVLVSSRQIYNISLDRDVLVINGDVNTSDEIRKILKLTDENNVKYTDTFPMTETAPFKFSFSTDPSEESTQRSRLSTYFKYFDDLDENISAPDFFVWIKKHYGLDYTTDLNEARRIIGIRYEMEIRAIDEDIQEYVFVEDADSEFISLLENSGIRGIRISQSTKREYHTNYAGQLLGYVRTMYKEDFETHPNYPMNAVIGKDGAELAFEDYLHGEDGLKTVYRADNGAIMEERITKQPIAGNNVYLSIDIGLQRQTEEALIERIEELNKTRDKDTIIENASAVVVSVDTGEVLSAASFPTYSPEQFEDDDYRETVLMKDPRDPLYNRATLGLYEPGSTFKPVTSLAGLRAGFIGRYSTYDTSPGYYDEYEGSTLYCWLYSLTGGNHGTLDVVGALENSCNMFYYWVSDKIDINYIIDTAHDFGLGMPTGIELPEKVGQVSSPEYKAKVADGEDWYPGDSMLAGIGQGYSEFTPIQLANYAATIANGGTHYKLTILHNVKNYDYSSVVYQNTPKAKNVIKEADFISILQEGMRTVVTSPNGSAFEIFSSYYVPVAAKTGTVQSDSSAKNSGVFICYAPADDPEVAIAVVAEKGSSGTNIMQIARQILDYYYAYKEEPAKVIGENVILP